MNMGPIWDYTKHMRVSNKNAHRSIKNIDGTHSNSAQEELKRCQEYRGEQFYITPKKITPQITHITEEQWGRIEIQQTKKNKHLFTTQRNKQATPNYPNKTKRAHTYIHGSPHNGLYRR